MTKTQPKPAAAPSEFSSEVIKVMAEVLAKKPAQIQPPMALLELVEESLDLVEVVMALKDHFDVPVVATDFDRLKTVADLIAYLEAKVKAKAKK